MTLKTRENIINLIVAECKSCEPISLTKVMVMLRGCDPQIGYAVDQDGLIIKIPHRMRSFRLAPKFNWDFFPGIPVWNIYSDDLRSQSDEMLDFIITALY